MESTTTPEKGPHVSQKKKYIRSPLKKIIIIRTVSFSSQSKIRLETEEIFKKRHLALDLTLIFLYLYDTLNRLIDKKNTIRYTIKIAKKVPESCRILKKTKISLKNVFFLFKKTSSSIL